MKSEFEQFKVGAFLPVVLAASVFLVSCFDTIKTTRAKTFNITTNPHGAEVSTAEGSSWKVIGRTPLEYRTEVPVLKNHFPGKYW